MKTNIPYGRQSISEEDIQSVISVLHSDYLTQGPIVPKFEEMVKLYCGSKYAIASNSATSSLHLACLALSVGAGDIVWTSGVTFAASSNCALYCGAEVDFVDIDPLTFNLCPSKLEAKLKRAKIKGRLPKVLIPVHLCGKSCDMNKIHQLSLEYNFKIIEDASHAIGGEYDERKIGSCHLSDIVVFSFHPVKIITCGEGGMALTNDQMLAEKMELLRSHGITRSKDKLENQSHGPWYYEQVALGFNYRMTDIHAALGLSQLKKLDSFVKKRNKIASKYQDALEALPIKFQKNCKASLSSYHLFVILLERVSSQNNHRNVFQKLRDCGIGVNLHYIPVYLHPYYKKLGFKEGHCPEAENYYKNAISIPIYPSMRKQQQDYVIQTIANILEAS